MKKLLVIALVIALSGCSKAPKQVEASPAVIASPESSVSPTVEPSPIETAKPSPQISEQKRKEHEAAERLNTAFDESNLRLAIAKYLAIYQGIK